MARYSISGTVSDTNIVAVRKKLAEVFKVAEEQIAATKIEESPSRADRLSAAENLVDQARDIVEELREEVQGWHDNLPENLQDGDKAQEIEECASQLEQVGSNLDEAGFGDVSFPSAF